MRLGLEGLPADGGPPRSFEAEWPDLARRLHAMLAGKRIPASKREDIVQETGLRLFRMWNAVDPDRPVWALAVTIALNLVRDEARRGIGREVLGFVPDRPAPHEDVERSGMARVELGRVEKALLELTPDHRSVLLAEVGDALPSTDRGANALKMLRMRARRRLTSLLDAASAGSAALVGGIRRSLGLDHHMYSLQAAGDPQQYQIPAVVGVLAMISILAASPGGFGAGEAPHERKDPIGREGIGAQVSLALADEAKTLTEGRSVAVRSFRPLRDIEPRKAYRPYRVHVPEDVGFLEAEAEIGAYGLGAQLGDHNGTPGCVFGLPLRQSQVEPREMMCTSPARGGRNEEPVYIRGRARGRIGTFRWHVEH